MNMKKTYMGLLFLLALGVVSAQKAQRVEPVAGTKVVSRTALPKVSKASEVTVLSEQQVAEGVTVRVVRDSRGRIYRDLVRNGVATPAPRSRFIRQPKISDEASFYEGFEDYDGRALGWLPKGWTEINTEGNRPTEEMMERNIDNTWHGDNTGDGYWTPITTDGTKECFIHFCYDAEYYKEKEDGEGYDTVKIPMAAQDEWLITPEITVKENHGLSFLLEFDLGVIYEFDWENYEYKRDVKIMDLEVLIQENGGDWDTLWRASEMIEDKTDDELLEYFGALQYFPIAVDLDDYFGKKVKIAFRYINTPPEGAAWSGNSAAIDAVTIDAPQAEGSYRLPANALLVGITPDFWHCGLSVGYMPFDVPIEWTANTNIHTKKTNWSVYNAETDKMEMMEGDTIRFSSPYSEGDIFPFPVLVASNDFSKTEFSFDAISADEEEGGIQYGGALPPLQGSQLLLGNYDYMHKFLGIPVIDEQGHPLFGKSNPSCWDDIFEQVGFGNYFPATDAPLTVSAVWVSLGTFQAEEDAELTVEIYACHEGEYGEGMQLGDTSLATSTIKAKDVMKVDMGDGSYFYQAGFPLKDKDGKPVKCVLQEDVIVFIKGFDSPKIASLSGISQYFDNDMDRNNAYLLFKYVNGTESKGMDDFYLYGLTELFDMSTSLFISLEACYNILRPEADVVMMDSAGVSAEFYVASGVAPEDWWVEMADGNKPLTSAVTDEWLTISVVSSEEGLLKFSAEPYAGRREKVVVLGSLGAEKATFTVVQDASYVGNEELKTQVMSVVKTGDQLFIEGAVPCVEAKLYTVTGMEVATARTDADGRVAIYVGYLNQGIYVLNAGGRSVKVLL